MEALEKEVEPQSVALVVLEALPLRSFLGQAWERSLPASRRVAEAELRAQKA
jgi:hypothetical protein